MDKLNVIIEGIRPLIMGNPQTVDIENPYAIESRRLVADLADKRRAKNEGRLIEIAREQKKNSFMSAAYFDAEASKFFLPDSVILAAIKEAAKSSKRGKDVDRCVIMTQTHAFIQGVPAVKSLEDAYSKDVFRLDVVAKVPPKKGALLMKTRCVMPTGWFIKFTLEHDPNIITATTLKEIIEYAGAMVGIGGWRPKFGRFKVGAV